MLDDYTRAQVNRAVEDALACTGESHDPGHRCAHCDEYVDRNSVVRKLIRAVLAAQGGDL